MGIVERARHAVGIDLDLLLSTCAQPQDALDAFREDLRNLQSELARVMAAVCSELNILQATKDLRSKEQAQWMDKARACLAQDDQALARLTLGQAHDLLEDLGALSRQQESLEREQATLKNCLAEVGASLQQADQQRIQFAKSPPRKSLEPSQPGNGFPASPSGQDRSAWIEATLCAMAKELAVSKGGRQP